MTREESWQVDGTTLTLLRHVTSLGYAVSVFRLPPSLLGTRPGAVEMHALDLSTEPPQKHVARVGDGEGGDPDYRCACLLAELVGVDLADGYPSAIPLKTRIQTLQSGYQTRALCVASLG